MNATGSRGAKRTTWVALLLVMWGSLLGGSQVAASTYPPPTPILTVPPNPVETSTPFEVTISGVEPGETVTFYFEGNDPITAVVGADGTATVTFISPPTPGVYDVTAQVGTGGVVLVGPVTVISAGTATTVPVTLPGTIPRTGSDSTSSLLLVGLGLLAFGGAFVAVARLRRSDNAPTAA